MKSSHFPSQKASRRRVPKQSNDNTLQSAQPDRYYQQLLLAKTETPRLTRSIDDETPYKLFFAQPPATWPDVLPVGNGRLGAMVFGRPGLERIQLNEESIWDGDIRDRNNPRAGATVPKIRELFFAGKIAEAEALATSDMLSIPRRMPCYQTLGDLHLDLSSSGLTSSLSFN